MAVNRTKNLFHAPHPKPSAQNANQTTFPIPNSIPSFIHPDKNKSHETPKPPTSPISSFLSPPIE
jgi:hypothetical protein